MLLRKLARHTLYGFAAFPLGLASLAGSRRACAVQVRLSHRLLGSPTDPEPDCAAPRHRIIAANVASLPFNLVAFALVASVWSIFVVRGFLYPAFGGDNLEDSWGGPTLAGAWLVHWSIGPPMVAAAAAVLIPLSRLQTRLLRLLGRGR